MTIAGYDLIFAALGSVTIAFCVMVVACAGGDPQPRFVPAQSPAAARCPVCSAGGGDHWVACSRCDTPHHAQCVRYAQNCAVFGCAGDPARAGEKKPKDGPPAG